MAIPLQASSRGLQPARPGGDRRTPVTLCADDYAIAPGVSLGIREAIEAGRLNATSAMTNLPFWPREAREFGILGRRADLGLHLNLTLGPPLTRMPGLAPGGVLPPLGTLVRAAMTRRLPMGEIAAEIDAQLDAFMDAAGRPPDFVDGHQHVHGLPGIGQVLIEALRRRGLGGRVWLRDSADRLGRLRRRGYAVRKAAGVSLLTRGFASRARAAGFDVNEGFAGFSSFDPRADYGTIFATYLRAPGARHLVMCHPGYVDDALEKLDPVTMAREYELAFLLSERFGDTLGAAGLRLARLQTAAV